MLICLCIHHLEPSKETNQSTIDQLQPTVSTQNSTSTEEKASNNKTVTEVFDLAIDANTESTDIQKGTEELLDISANIILDANERSDCIMMIYGSICLLCLLSRKPRNL
jgi:hypothetical protein